MLSPSRKADRKRAPVAFLIEVVFGNGRVGLGKPLAIFFSLLVCTAVSAQDGSESSGARTPENAQQFLRVAADRFGLSMAGDRVLISGRFADYKLRYGNLQVSSDERCTTRFDGTITEFFFKDDTGTVVASGPNTSAATINALGHQYGKSYVKAAPFVIDWSTVTKVGVGKDYDPQKGTREVPEAAFAQSPTTSITLIAPSEEIAGRLRLAMETLRLACDSTQSLGF